MYLIQNALIMNWKKKKKRCFSYLLMLFFKTQLLSKDATWDFMAV